MVFLLYLALGHLPALFALPAGLGDITTGITAPLAARRFAYGTGRRAVWCAARSPRPPGCRSTPSPSHLEIDARDRLVSAVTLNQAATLTTGSGWAEPVAA